MRISALAVFISGALLTGCASKFCVGEFCNRHNEFAYEQARMKATYEHYECCRERRIVCGLGGALFKPME